MGTDRRKEFERESLFDILGECLNEKFTLKSLLVTGALTGVVGFGLGRLSVTENNPYIDSATPGRVYVDLNGDGKMDIRMDETYSQLRKELIEYRSKARSLPK